MRLSVTCCIAMQYLDTILSNTLIFNSSKVIKAFFSPLMLLCFCFHISDKHRPGEQRLPLSWVSHGPIWGTEESTLGNSICCNSSVPAGPLRAVSWPQQLALWVWQTRVSIPLPSSLPVLIPPFYFPFLQLLVCSSHLFWEHLLLFTLSSQL